MGIATENKLKRSTPEAQGIASTAVLKFVEALENQVDEIHSFMLLRHGHVVAEGWWSPYAPTLPHMLFSLSKSFTSTAVGLAINEGLFSLDDPVTSFFPDVTPDNVSDNLKAMTVHHLLSMSTGHDEDTTPHMVGRTDGNWTQGFFDVPVLHEPGTHFLYNTGATYMLSAIVQKKTGLKLTEYLQPRLFEPLGIENPVWQVSPQGIETGGFGLNITTEDIARFGQLYLQKGMWQDKQLIPEAWIAEATKFQVDNAGNDTNQNIEWAQGYGYQFWMCRHNIYRGDGAFGQYCIVMPEQDAVLAMTSGVADMQQPMDIAWDILLPAMQDEALAEDAAHDALINKLGHLELQPVQGASSSPIASAISGRTYTLDDNPLNIQSVAFDFGNMPQVTIKVADVEEIFACGYDKWEAGQTTLLIENRWFDAAAIMCSGAWTSDESYKMQVRLHETPFYHRLVFEFADDDISVTTHVNVSFDEQRTQPLKINGHIA